MTVSYTSPETRNKPDIVTSDLYNLEDAAKYLKVSPVTFWTIRKSANLKYTLIGKRKYYHRDVLDSYLGIKSEPLFSISIVAEHFNVSINLIEDLEQRGKLKSHHFNGQMRYYLSEVETALNQEAEA